MTGDAVTAAPHGERQAVETSEANGLDDVGRCEGADDRPRVAVEA